MRRIQKLLAIAQDDRANPNEAASAAGMAERIMRKYQLEEADLIASTLRSGDDLDTADTVGGAKTNGTPNKIVALWVNILAVQVAKLNACGVRSARTAEGKACVRFYGYSADVRVAKWTLDYLVATTNRLCNNFKQTPEYMQYGRCELNSYRTGVAVGISRAIKILIEKKISEELPTGTSLVIIKYDAIAKKYGEFSYSRKKPSVRGGSYATGVADGKSVNVNLRAVASTPAGPALLSSK